MCFPQRFDLGNTREKERNWKVTADSSAALTINQEEVEMYSEPSHFSHKRSQKLRVISCEILK